MYRHIKKYWIRYTDVDAFDRIKLSSVLSVLEESACLSADELGFGYAAVAPKNIGFIIVNCYVEFFREVKLGDHIAVHTWPLKPRHQIFFRDFELYSGEELVGVATTRWCMVDLNTFAMLPPSAFFADDAFESYNVERCCNFSQWKIPQLTDGKYMYSKIAACSDCDHYFHVNNTKYADLLLDVFNFDDLKDKYISNAQITFVKQCKAGEKIDFYLKETEEGCIIEGRVDGELRAAMRVKFNEIQI